MSATVTGTEYGARFARHRQQISVIEIHGLGHGDSLRASVPYGMSEELHLTWTPCIREERGGRRGLSGTRGDPDFSQRDEHRRAGLRGKGGGTADVVDVCMSKNDRLYVRRFATQFGESR